LAQAAGNDDLAAKIEEALEAGSPHDRAQLDQPHNSTRGR